MPAGGQKRKLPPAAAEQAAAAPPESALFSGCQLVFWAQRHMQRMQQRVQQLGGTLQPALTAGSTHVVCPPGMTPQQAAERLESFKG